MAVRIRYKASAILSSTSAEERDLGNGNYEVVVDSQGEGWSGKVALAAGAVDVPIHLPPVASAKFLALRTTPKNPNDACHNVTIKKDSTLGEAIVIAPLSPTKEGFMMLTTSGIASLFASNPGSTAMDVTVHVAGD